VNQRRLIAHLLGPLDGRAALHPLPALPPGPARGNAMVVRNPG
jgi:hypothetical protein